MRLISRLFFITLGLLAVATGALLACGIAAGQVVEGYETLMICVAAWLAATGAFFVIFGLCLPIKRA